MSTRPPEATRAGHLVVPVDRDTAARLSLDSGMEARLSFDSGMENVHLLAGEDPGTLLDARFGDPAPLSWFAGHNVHVEYPLGSRLLRRPRRADLRLNPSVPWALDVHGGAQHLDADLTGIDLRSVALHSAAAHLRFALGRPSGPRTLRFAAVHALRVERPAGVPVRLEITGSAARIRLDDREYGAVGGGLAEHTVDHRPDAAGYRIVVSGAADTVTVVAVP